MFAFCVKVLMAGKQSTNKNTNNLCKSFAQNLHQACKGHNIVSMQLKTENKMKKKRQREELWLLWADDTVEQF